MLNDLTQAELKAILYYSPDTGQFYRLRFVERGPTGRPNTDGYLQVSIRGKYYMAHRLAWLYMTGEWPDDEIDHKDRNKTNNMWSNLRPATGLQNTQNLPAHSDNATGTIGVSYNKRDKVYQVRICVNYEQRCLGNFKTLDEAIEARRVAKGELHLFNPVDK